MTTDELAAWCERLPRDDDHDFDHVEIGRLKAVAAALRSHAGVEKELAECRSGETWRCFHCDVVFTNRRHAAEHFGAEESDVPACRLSHSEGHLITYIRKLQRELASYRREDNLILRAWDAKVMEGVNAVRRAEETGFNRGVQDAKKMFEEELTADRDAARSEVARLTAELRHLISCVLTVAKENTDEWMEYIPGVINRAANVLGESDRAVYDPGRGDLRIERRPDLADAQPGAAGEP